MRSRRSIREVVEAQRKALEEQYTLLFGDTDERPVARSHMEPDESRSRR